MNGLFLLAFVCCDADALPIKVVFLLCYLLFRLWPLEGAAHRKLLHYSKEQWMY